ncbi:MAG: galactose-epimerase [Micavibrio sp.]|nr:galactose-epimerase [Micavibrio sp.]
MSERILEIRKNSYALGIGPENGGCVTFFKKAATDIFAPFNQDHPASIVMTPIGNRQSCTRSVNGVEYRVGSQHGKETGNYLHGDGWKSSWSVKAHEDEHIILSHTKNQTPEACDSYYAEQEFRLLENDTLLMGVSVTNTGKDDLVAGPGHHPWFPRDEQTIVRIDAPAQKVWVFDYNMRLQPSSLIDLPAEWDFNSGVRMMNEKLPSTISIADEFLMDSCIPNVGAIHVIQPSQGFEIVMTTDRKGHAVVYNPTREKDFCVVEAVPSIPYAAQLMAQGVKDTGATVLKTGETMKFNTYLKIQQL